MAYQHIPNPTSPAYTNISPAGLYIFDDTGVKFDDINVEFDGNDDIYTAVPAPTTPSYTSSPAPTSP